MIDPKKGNKKPGQENDAYLPSEENEGYIEPEQQDGMEPEDLDSDDENV